MLKVVCSPDLGYILNACEEGCHDAQSGGPVPKVLRRECGKDPCHDDDREAMEQCERRNQ